jgi:hypothetical protein
MNYKDKVDKIVGLLLENEELETNCQVILDSELAYDVAKELYYKLDKPFLIEEEDQFEKDLKENDILGVAVSIYEDGETLYFLQPIMNDEGETYEDEVNEALYIQDDLLDCVDVEEFRIADIYILTECDENCCDCESCKNKQEYSEYEREMDDYLDESIFEVHKYFADTLIEHGEDEDFDFHELIDEIIYMAFFKGFDKAIEE